MVSWNFEERIPFRPNSETNEPHLRPYQLWKKARYEEALRKSDQMHQTFEKSSLAVTYKLDVIRELPKSVLKKTNKEDLDCKMPTKYPQVLASFKEYTPPVTYPEEVEETLGTPVEVEPLDKMKLENVGFNTCNHDIPLSYREVLSFDEPDPQPQPLPSCPSLDVSLGDKRGPEPPIHHLHLTWRLSIPRMCNAIITHA
ncbi:hypothetical protein Tco_0646233 [Tanacetum coccineum]